MIQLIVDVAINAALLSVTPWVKHKGYGSCFLVAAVMAVAGWLLTVLAIPMLLIGVLVSCIPILGVLAGLPFLLLMIWLINTLALYVADKAIDGFEIASFGQTALVALFLSLAHVIIAGLLP